MEKSGAIITLPKELLSAILTEWLYWVEIGLCDSAMCNKVARKLWLDVLGKGSVFDCVSTGYLSPSNYFRWILQRNIRTRRIIIDTPCHFEEEELAMVWMQHTGPFVTSLTSNALKDVSVQSIAYHCTNLHVLFTKDWYINDANYEILCCLPKLQELHILGNLCKLEACPANLSFPSLRKLEIGADLCMSDQIVSLLQHLPFLRSLKFAQTYIDQAFESLSTVYLPNLVHLHFECIYYNSLDFTHLRFAEVIKGLTIGLRCFVVSANRSFTAQSLQALATYHGHSLRCLDIQESLNWKLLSCTIDLSDEFNRMSSLHTLKLSYVCLSTLSAPIVNPKITHLYLSLSSVWDDLNFLYESFPNLHTLSLKWYPHGYIRHELVIPMWLPLLEKRPEITTLCVSCDTFVKELRIALPNVLVKKYVDIDIFSTDY